MNEPSPLTPDAAGWRVCGIREFESAVDTDHNGSFGTAASLDRADRALRHAWMRMEEAMRHGSRVGSNRKTATLSRRSSVALALVGVMALAGCQSIGLGSRQADPSGTA